MACHKYTPTEAHPGGREVAGILPWATGGEDKNLDMARAAPRSVQATRPQTLALPDNRHPGTTPLPAHYPQPLPIPVRKCPLGCATELGGTEAGMALGG